MVFGQGASSATLEVPKNVWRLLRRKSLVGSFPVASTYVKRQEFNSISQSTVLMYWKSWVYTSGYKAPASRIAGNTLEALCNKCMTQ